MEALEATFEFKRSADRLGETASLAALLTDLWWVSVFTIRLLVFLGLVFMLRFRLYGIGMWQCWFWVS